MGKHRIPSDQLWLHKWLNVAKPIIERMITTSPWCTPRYKYRLGGVSSVFSCINPQLASSLLGRITS